jgi:NAD(P)H-flavin reductase
MHRADRIDRLDRLDGRASTFLKRAFWGLSIRPTLDTGFVTKELIAKHLPPPAKDTVILLCGPKPMVKKACVPALLAQRDEHSALLITLIHIFFKPGSIMVNSMTL